VFAPVTGLGLRARALEWARPWIIHFGVVRTVRDRPGRRAVKAVLTPVIRLGIVEGRGRLALNGAIACQPAAAYHNSSRE
jgi:hypothetical protein